MILRAVLGILSVLDCATGILTALAHSKIMTKSLSSMKRPLSRRQKPLSSAKKPLSRTRKPRSSAKKPLSRTGKPLSSAKKPLSRTRKPLYHTKPPPSRLAAYRREASASVPVAKRTSFLRKFGRLAKDILATTDQAELSRAVSAFLGDAVSVSFAELLVADSSAPVFRSVVTPSRTLPRALIGLPGAGGDRDAVPVDDLLRSCAQADRRFLEDAEGGFLVRLPVERGSAALLLVGRLESWNPFSREVVGFLTAFGAVLSIAVERNTLLARVRTEQARISKMEKLASLGRLTAGIAHEFRNPLNIISTSAQTILRNPDNVALHVETGRYILEETERLTRTVDEFLQFAKPHTPVWEQVKIADVIANASQGLLEIGRAREVRVETDVEPSLPRITTSPQHIERVLRNLGLNAIEAMQPGGTLTFAAFRQGAGRIAITVSDTGPGIPPEHHARLFDPFFTTKPEGTGLGLAIVYMLIEAVRGGITFTSTSLGTTFCIELPMNGNLR
ncbi:MAG: putative Histidine kinase [Bacteroidetes bacterium]|nr:putative Histidine kinase [Bacteroidota bacterium]